MMFLGLRKLGNICCRHKMFLNKIRNIFCAPDTKFVSATNVACAGKRGNICVGNNVSLFTRALRYGFGCFRESYLDQGRIFSNNVQMSEKSQLNHEKSELIPHSHQLNMFNLTRFRKMNKGGKFLKKLWCCVGGNITR